MKKWPPFFFILFAVLPLGGGLVYALLYSLGIVGALSQGITFEYWTSTIVDSNLWISLGMSAIIATLTVLISTGVALLLSIWLRPLLELPRIRFLHYLPLAIPPMVAAFISFQWLGNSGILSRVFFNANLLKGMEAFPALINDPYYLGVAITMIMSTFPFLLLIFLDQYRSANLAQLSALAATLGAASYQINQQIVAPILLQRVQPTLVLYGVFLFGSYEIPLLLGRQNPAMISMFIHQKFSRFNLLDLPAAYVATVVYAIIVLFLVSLLLQKRDVSRSKLSAE